MAEEDLKNTILINKHGIIALGTGLPAESNIQHFFQDKTIIQVSCGKDHSAVVCNSGRVYTFGKNQDNGWIENGSDTVAEPSLVATLATVKITQAACGYQYTMFLTDKGELYSCGVNEKGQLGLGHTNKSPSPVLVTGLPPLKKVAAGNSHSVALTDSGEVWVTGFNAKGTLGIGDTNNQSSFTRVPNLSEPIIDIACGWLHTTLLTETQVLLTAGSNPDGQLGLGAIENLHSFGPVSVPSSAVSAMSCGSHHVVALRADGTAWSFGSNKFGQLGIENDDENSSIPTRILGLENHTVSKVYAGYSHTALVTEEGDVLVCGKGSHDELGEGKENLSLLSLLPKSPHLIVKQVAFAESYSLILVVPKSSISPTSQLQGEASALQSDQIRGFITVCKKTVMQTLECPVCFKIMCAPIRQCLKGHSLCDACLSNTRITVCPSCREPFGRARNIALERLSLEIQLPCVDCLIPMPMCQLEEHLKVCPNRKYSCPVTESCSWSGRPETMLGHTSYSHPKQTWQDLPHTFLHSTCDELVHTDILAAYDEVFTLHRLYNNKMGEFKASARYIGPLDNKDKFNLEFTFLSNNEKRTYLKEMCADIESEDVMFQSPNCVILNGESVNTFLQQGCLVCQAAIVKVETCYVADQVNALFTAVG